MINGIVKGIDEEIAHLQKVRELLAGINTDMPRQPGRPRKVVAAAAEVKPRRTLNAKTRKAIAEAQRKRWAAQKAEPAHGSAVKKSAKKTASKTSA